MLKEIRERDKETQELIDAALVHLSNRFVEVHQDRSELLKLLDEVLNEAATIIYLNDNSDYIRALWTIVRKISPDTAEQLEKDTYRPYPEA